VVENLPRMALQIRDGTNVLGKVHSDAPLGT
jgi:hypothetical protein